MTENLYDINDYSDEDLLKILDLSNPTDRELEAKIIIMIRKYEGTDRKMARFFNEIYEHFFDTQTGSETEESYDEDEDEDEDETEENEIEGFSGKEEPMTDEELSKEGWSKKWSEDKKKYYYINTKSNPPKTQWTVPTKAIISNDPAYKETDTAKERSEKEKNAYNNAPSVSKISDSEINKTSPPQTFNDTNTQTTRAIEYPSGWLNPLIKETFKRVLYLDSQYRNKTFYPDSSSYSINLSDTLITVLAIRLHSITIPYSWYTIPNFPRANQIILKGNAPGINDGFHDIIIDIDPGNYSSQYELVTTVNNKIKNDLPTKYPDVSFNDTRIELDPITTFSALYININSSYTKSKLVFSPTTYTNSRSLEETIPSFLGFQYNEYHSNIIKSNQEYAVLKNSLPKTDIFQVYPKVNDYFTIRNYIDESNIEDIIVTLDFTVSPFTQDFSAPKQYTRQAFENCLNRALKNNSKLSDEESSITIERINNEYQSYKLIVELNRNTTKSGHQYIIFPDESNNSLPIWTGPNSCFMFDNDSMNDPIHNIYSESSPAEMRYIVFTSPYILLNCILTPNYTCRINIPNSPEIGYTQDEYIDVINEAVLQVSNTLDISLNFILKKDNNIETLYLAIAISKEFEDGTVMTELDYHIEFYDESGVYVDMDGTEKSSWEYYLGFNNTSYALINPEHNPIESHFCEIYAENPIRDVELAVHDENNSFNIEQHGITNQIIIPTGVYTKSVLYKTINTVLKQNPVTKDVLMTSTIKNGQLKTLLKLAAKTKYTTKDYQLIFFDVLSVGSCDKIETKSVINTTWDVTLGWMLGFRAQYQYTMNVNTPPNTFKLIGNTAVSVNSVNQAIVVLDDYNQNHLNDGVVTVAKQEKTIALPSYANAALNRCDPVTGQSVPAFTNTSTSGGNLTQNQVYSAQQISQSSNNQLQFFADPPYITDMFAFVPLKIPSNHGDTIVVDGGTLQDNTRVYFGPVNIRRLNIQLLNERGRFISLNGRDWSMTVICECQYTANKDQQSKMKSGLK